MKYFKSPAARFFIITGFFVLMIVLLSDTISPRTGSALMPPGSDSAVQRHFFIDKWGSHGSDDGQFEAPVGVAVDSLSRVYVTDLGNHRVQKFTSSGQFIRKWGSHGSGNWQFEWAWGIAASPEGYIYVADSWNHRVSKFDLSGNYVSKWGSYGSGNGRFNEPYGVAVDSVGNVYVADTFNHRIQKFTSSGDFITKWGSYGSGDGQFKYPYGVVVDSTGYVYVTDLRNHRVQKFTSSGDFVAKWGDYGSGKGQFSYPYDITVDSRDYIYVGDLGRHRIQKFRKDGVFAAQWGSYGSGDGEFVYPHGIAMDPNGYLYVADTDNYRIQKLDVTMYVYGWARGNRGEGGFVAEMSYQPAAPGLGTINPDVLGQYLVDVSNAGTYTITVAHADFGSLSPMYLGLTEDTEANFVLPPQDNVIANWEFESGSLGSWTTGGDFVPTISTNAHTGHYGVAFQGQSAVGEGYLSQDITVTGHEPVLSFMYLLAGGNPANGGFQVVIDGTEYDVPLAGDGWTHAWYDLSAFSGQELELGFRMWQDVANPLTIYLDEVSVGTAAYGPTKTYAPLSLRDY